MCSESSIVYCLKSTFYCVHLKGGGGGSEKVYSLYTCENVDNCERPLIQFKIKHMVNN